MLFYRHSVRHVSVLMRLLPLNRGDPVTLCHRFHVGHVRRRHYQRAAMRGALALRHPTGRQSSQYQSAQSDPVRLNHINMLGSAAHL